MNEASAGNGVTPLSQPPCDNSRRTIEERLTGIADFFEGHKSQFDTDKPSEDVAVWAWAYWKRWPEFLGSTNAFIQDYKRTEHSHDCDYRISEHGLRQALFWAYESAVRWLMRQAESRGIESSDMMKSRHIVRAAILGHATYATQNWQWPHDWPDLIAPALNNLSQIDQEAVVSGNAVFEQLVARLENEATGACGIVDGHANSEEIAQLVAAQIAKLLGEKKSRGPLPKVERQDRIDYWKRWLVAKEARITLSTFMRDEGVDETYHNTCNVTYNRHGKR
ncbi:hypothetical protein [Rhodopirellula bahusiensis]|nr:hypothetical protein [Rhodopirellula bahusiensis]